MRRHRENLVPILAISARPADLLERLPSVYQVRQLVPVRHTPSLWEQWCALARDAVLWGELDRLLTLTEAERLPVVLDSRGMSASLLARVLVRLDQSVPQPGVIGVVSKPASLAAQRVLALSASVQAIVPVTTLCAKRGVQQVAQAAWRAPRSRNVAPQGADPGSLLPLPRGFLPVFAALPGAGDVEQVSRRSTYSRPRVFQVLAAARRVLAMPERCGKHYAPYQLARELTDALGRPGRCEHPPRSSRPSPQIVSIAVSEQRMNEDSDD